MYETLGGIGCGIGMRMGKINLKIPKKRKQK